MRLSKIVNDLDFEIILFCLVALGLASFLVITTAPADATEYKMVDQVPVYSIKMMNSEAATFIFGTGSAGVEHYYVFYKQSEHGNLILEKVKATNVELLRTDKESPKIVTYEKFNKYSTPWKVWFKGEEEPSGYEYKVLVIPTNAIESLE